MFEQVFENLQKATESSVKMQQEMFQKWFESVPTAAAAPSTSDAFAEWQKKLEDLAADLLQQQKALVDQNYEAGMKALEDMFGVAEAKSHKNISRR